MACCAMHNAPIAAGNEVYNDNVPSPKTTPKPADHVSMTPTRRQATNQKYQRH